jgi:hypothetical protein
MSSKGKSSTQGLAHAAFAAQHAIGSVKLHPTISTLDARQKLRSVVARLHDISDELEEAHRYALLTPQASGTNFDEGKTFALCCRLCSVYLHWPVSLCSDAPSDSHSPKHNTARGC